MSEFRFADPHFVHWLWGVLVAVAVLLWLDQRRGSALDRLLSPLLQSRIVRRPSVGLRRTRILLLGLAGVCLVLALMRPQWGLRRVATQRAGAEIMIALDVSRSMLAEDVAPNRLARAKAEIADLLGYLRGDQTHAGQPQQQDPHPAQAHARPPHEARLQQRGDQTIERIATALIQPEQ